MDIFDGSARVKVVGGKILHYMRAITIPGFVFFDIWLWPYYKHITVCRLILGSDRFSSENAKLEKRPT